MRVSQHDIARRAGVHKSTVSLALRNHPSLMVKTRERIQELARVMGYRPDPALATIASHRWDSDKGSSNHVLAFVTMPHALASATGQQFLQGPATDRAQERGFDLQVFNFADYPNGKALSRVLYSRGIQGVLLAPRPPAETAVGLSLEWSHFTSVCCMLGWTRLPLHTVEFDWFYAIRHGWAEALARGYRRIGPALLGHAPPSENDMTCLGAVCAEQIELPPGYKAIPAARSRIRGREDFITWLDQNDPDLVLGFDDSLLAWIRSTGRRVPEDVGFMSFAATQPGVSGFVRQIDRIARSGVDLLIAKMREFERGVPAIQQTVLIKPEWREGMTLRAKPHR